MDPTNAALKTLSTKISTRKAQIEIAERKRREREERIAAERQALSLALRSRNIPTRQTEQAPDLEDAAVKLSEPLDPSSSLSFPVILLYPTHSQSDFIKAFGEKENLAEHLSYILPVPWDEQGEYTVDNVDGYMETIAGGLIKVGKRMGLGKILGSGKCEVVDGLVKINVIPKPKADSWITEFKKRRAN